MSSTTDVLPSQSTRQELLQQKRRQGTGRETTFKGLVIQQPLQIVQQPDEEASAQATTDPNAVLTSVLQGFGRRTHKQFNLEAADDSFAFFSQVAEDVQRATDTSIDRYLAGEFDDTSMNTTFNTAGTRDSTTTIDISRRDSTKSAGNIVVDEMDWSDDEEQQNASKATPALVNNSTAAVNTTTATTTTNTSVRPPASVSPAKVHSSQEPQPERSQTVIPSTPEEDLKQDTPKAIRNISVADKTPRAEGTTVPDVSPIQHVSRVLEFASPATNFSPAGKSPATVASETMIRNLNDSQELISLKYDPSPKRKSTSPPAHKKRRLDKTNRMSIAPPEIDGEEPSDDDDEEKAVEPAKRKSIPVIESSATPLRSARRSGPPPRSAKRPNSSQKKANTAKEPSPPPRSPAKPKESPKTSKKQIVGDDEDDERGPAITGYDDDYEMPEPLPEPDPIVEAPAPAASSTPAVRKRKRTSLHTTPADFVQKTAAPRYTDVKNRRAKKSGKQDSVTPTAADSDTPYRRIPASKRKPNYKEEEQQDEEEDENYDAEKADTEAQGVEEEDDDDDETSVGLQNADMSVIAKGGAKKSLRRSNRVRQKPVEWYRGERPSASQPDIVMRPKTPAKKKIKPKRQIKEGVVEQKRGKFPILFNEDEVEMDVVRTKEMMQEQHFKLVPKTNDLDAIDDDEDADEEPQESDISLSMGLVCRRWKCGIMKVGPESTKPRQNTNDYSEVFYVIHGSPEVTIHKSELKLHPGSFFHVPPQNSFQIKNPSTTQECKLVFFMATWEHIQTVTQGMTPRKT